MNFINFLNNHQKNLAQSTIRTYDRFVTRNITNYDYINHNQQPIPVKVGHGTNVAAIRKWNEYCIP